VECQLTNSFRGLTVETRTDKPVKETTACLCLCPSPCISVFWFNRFFPFIFGTFLLLLLPFILTVARIWWWVLRFRFRFDSILYFVNPVVDVSSLRVFFIFLLLPFKLANPRLVPVRSAWLAKRGSLVLHLVPAVAGSQSPCLVEVCERAPYCRGGHNPKVYNVLCCCILPVLSCRQRTKNTLCRMLAKSVIR